MSGEVASTSTVLASPVKGLSPAPPLPATSPALTSVEEEVEAALPSLPSEEAARYSSSFEHTSKEESSTVSEMAKVSALTVDKLTDSIWQQLLEDTSRAVKVTNKVAVEDAKKVVEDSKKAVEVAKSPKKTHTRSRSVSLKPQDLMLSTFDLTSSSDESSPRRRVVEGMEAREAEDSDQDSSTRHQSPDEAEQFMDDDFDLSAIRQEAEILRLQQQQVEQEIARIALEAEEAARSVPDRPPPPYIPPSPAPPRPAPPPRPVVPNTKEQVEALLDTFVHTIFAAREAGRRVEEVGFVAVPVEDESLTEGEVGAVQQYQRMVWEVAVEKVEAVYRHEGMEQRPPWLPALPLGKLRFLAPRTEAGLRERVGREVLADLGLVARVAREGLMVRWSGKKRDRVDEILVRELQQEEEGWTDYSREEAMVKEQTAEGVLEALVQDTVEVMVGLFKRRQERSGGGRSEGGK